MSTTNQSITNLITTGGRFRIVYLDPQGEITERVIDVERIFTHEHTGSRLMVAFCHRRHAYRTFNMAGILAAMPDDSIFVATFGMLMAAYRSDSASRLAGWN